MNLTGGVIMYELLEVLEEYLEIHWHDKVV